MVVEDLCEFLAFVQDHFIELDDDLYSAMDPENTNTYTREDIAKEFMERRASE